MNFKIGDKVRRRLIDIDGDWTASAVRRRQDPYGVYTISGIDGNCIFLEERSRYALYFPALFDPAEPPSLNEDDYL